MTNAQVSGTSEIRSVEASSSKEVRSEGSTSKDGCSEEVGGKEYTLRVADNT